MLVVSQLPLLAFADVSSVVSGSSACGGVTFNPAVTNGRDGAGEFRRHKVRHNLKANILPPDHREETVSGDDGES